MLPPWFLVTHNISQKGTKVQRKRICYQRSNKLLKTYCLAKTQSRLHKYRKTSVTAFSHHNARWEHVYNSLKLF